MESQMARYCAVAGVGEGPSPGRGKSRLATRPARVACSRAECGLYQGQFT
jgi:hypothetical protein